MATHSAAKSGAKVMMVREVGRVLIYSKFVDLPCRMLLVDVFVGAADLTGAPPGLFMPVQPKLAASKQAMVPSSIHSR